MIETKFEKCVFIQKSNIKNSHMSCYINVIVPTLQTIMNSIFMNTGRIFISVLS